MKKNTCFVLMPFGTNFDEYYKEIYCPAIEDCDLLPRRADSLYRPSPILHDIWSFINDSPLIIADITDRNPNVMYELGLAHAVAKPVIIITNSIDDVPFDLRSLRILIYNTSKPLWANILRDAIKNSIKETLESPTDAVLPTFLNVTMTKKEEVSEIKKDLIEIKQYLYRLDFDENDDTDHEQKAKILSSGQYAEALKDAHRLYYSEGLDILDIKKYLMEKYSTGTYTVTDILSTVRRE